MTKKVILFILVLILGLYFIAPKKIGKEVTKRRGLTEVYNEIGDKSNRHEVIEQAKTFRREKKFSLARRTIEENIVDARNDMKFAGLLDELDKLSLFMLKKHSMKVCAQNNELCNYYNRITEESINSLDIKSKTNRLVFVDVQEQKTNIFIKKNDRWYLENVFTCATGQEETPTPVGIFEIGIKGNWFYSPKFDRGAKYYVGFLGGEYLFHSIPYYSDQKTIWEERLGVPMSHGCIRHSTENQKWFFDNVDIGTKVVIY